MNKSHSAHYSQELFNQLRPLQALILTDERFLHFQLGPDKI
jgi:hypothetical protein